jgi:MFS family permease
VEVFVFVAIAAGLLCGSGLAYFIAGRMVAGIAERTSRPVLVSTLSAVGALTAALPSAFLAFVVGGNFGGAYADSFVAVFGSVAIAVGVLLGIALLFCCLVLAREHFLAPLQVSLWPRRFVRGHQLNWSVQRNRSRFTGGAIGATRPIADASDSGENPRK